MQKLHMRHMSKNKAPYGYQSYYFEGVRQYLKPKQAGSCKFHQINFFSAFALNRKMKAWLEKNTAPIDEHVGVYLLKTGKAAVIFSN